jgi:hypothetical protein
MAPASVILLLSRLWREDARVSVCMLHGMPQYTQRV